jgi:hypothetical protein
MSKRPAYLSYKNKVLQLYLIGLKGFFETRRSRPYGFYQKAGLLVACLTAVKYLTYNIITEFENLDHPNFLIPAFVYKSREDHYRYWELSRITRQKNALFSYYDYDDVADFMFYNYETGVQLSEKNYLNIEKVENVSNPLFEKYIREFKQSQTRESLRNGNLLIAYNKNINNNLELKNYLHYKTVNLGDWLRGAYYKVMVGLKLTNYYRYDHIISKDDQIYNYEKLKISMNLPYKARERRIQLYSRIFDGLMEIDNQTQPIEKESHKVI